MSKSTLLINKTIVTHGGTTPITKELNKKNRDHAFCIFITGLKASFRDILFFFFPQDLADTQIKELGLLKILET